jgi:hypothetical protein
MVMLLKVDLAYHRLSEFEHARRIPDLMTVMRYARVAGIPMEYIADDEVDLKTFRDHLEAADEKRRK